MVVVAENSSRLVFNADQAEFWRIKFEQKRFVIVKDNDRLQPNAEVVIYEYDFLNDCITAELFRALIVFKSTDLVEGVMDGYCVLQIDKSVS